MDGNNPNQVDERRAALLLGLSTAELRRLSRLSGVGRLENCDGQEIMVFTYEELRKICLMTVPAYH